MQIKEKERQDDQNIILYTASNTGLHSESTCTQLEFTFQEENLIEIFCHTTSDQASEAVDSAYNMFKDKGGGVGTGTYFWCIHENRGLEIFVDPVMSSYVGIKDSCFPEGNTK